MLVSSVVQNVAWRLSFPQGQDGLRGEPGSPGPNGEKVCKFTLSVIKVYLFIYLFIYL